MPPLPSSSIRRYVPSTEPRRSSGSSRRLGTGGGIDGGRCTGLLRALGDSTFVRSVRSPCVPTASDGCESRLASSGSISSDCVGSRASRPSSSGRSGGRDLGSRVVMYDPPPHVVDVEMGGYARFYDRHRVITTKGFRVVVLGLTGRVWV